MNISRNKGPLYMQIKNIMKDRICHNIYPLHSLIPPEPQLEKEFKVSKITIRNAIRELVQEGLLETKSGIGTRVINNRSNAKLFKGKRFTEMLVEEGHVIRKRLLDAVSVQTEPGSELARLFGERCSRISRIYLLDGTPYIHFTHYLSDRFSIEAEHIEQQSLYAFIDEQHIELDSFRDEFAVEPVPSDIAVCLNVDDDTPLLKRFRYSYDAAGELVEYSIGYYRTELHRYVSKSN